MVRLMHWCHLVFSGLRSAGRPGGYLAVWIEAFNSAAEGGENKTYGGEGGAFFLSWYV